MAKKRGRPPIDPKDAQASVTVHVRLPGKQYEAAIAQATRARMALADWIRHTLRTDRGRS